MARHSKNDKPVLTPEHEAVETVNDEPKIGSALTIEEAETVEPPEPPDSDSGYDELVDYCLKEGSSINGLTRIYGPGEPLKPEYFAQGKAKIEYLLGLGLLEKCKDK